VRTAALSSARWGQRGGARVSSCDSQRNQAQRLGIALRDLARARPLPQHAEGAAAMRDEAIQQPLAEHPKAGRKDHAGPAATVERTVELHVAASGGVHSLDHAPASTGSRALDDMNRDGLVLRADQPERR
jgi:hypothetical protein